MRRGNNNNNNGSRDTVNAAAEAIALAENRARQIETRQRRRRTPKCLPCFFPCFFSCSTQTKKINQAALAPLPSPSQPVTTSPLQPNPPPSSPASTLSLLQSETNSINHSPSPAFSFGPYSIGPFAHETQLVSPPVWSTEPSTAPFTPPPESVQLILTTPNSPEVPFARFLTRFDPNGANQISPNSVCSSNSNSSPCGKGSSFPTGETPKIIDIGEISARKSTPFHSRKDGSLLDGSISAKEFEIECDELEREESERNGYVREKLEGERSESSVFKFDNSEGNNSNGKSEVTKNWPFFPSNTARVD